MKRIFISFIILLLSTVLIYRLIQYIEIKKNQEFTIGKISAGNQNYRNWSFSLNYTYIINGKNYNEVSGTQISGKHLNKFINKYFPVVYSTKDPEISILLISPEDFSDWGLVFPDSLNWVKDKLKY